MAKKASRAAQSYYDELRDEGYSREQAAAEATKVQESRDKRAKLIRRKRAIKRVLKRITPKRPKLKRS